MVIVPEVGTTNSESIPQHFDATIRASNEHRKSLINEWGTHSARTFEGQASVNELEIGRGPQIYKGGDASKREDLVTLLFGFLVRV